MKTKFTGIGAVAGALSGAIAGEFFPRLLSHFVGGMKMLSINNPFSNPFDSARNEVAFKYGLIFLVIGGVIGLMLDMAAPKRGRK